MITFSRIGTHGHLGNQLFQVAAVAAHAHKMGTDWMLPNNKYTQKLKMFFPNVQVGDPGKVLVYNEPKFAYQPIIEEDSLDLFGYFQSDKYWNGLDIKELLAPVQSVIDHTTARHEIDHLTCSLHIRRGDYLKFQHVFEMLGADYYSPAIEKMRSFGVNKFIIFSDDPEYCKRFISGPGVSYSEGLSDVEDMILMSQIPYAITANSSFSWWGSFLGINKSKVIAPKKWFVPSHHERPDDIYREEMLLI